MPRPEWVGLEKQRPVSRNERQVAAQPPVRTVAKWHDESEL